MVDPIDGTRDFIAGDTGFVVMIGLAIDGRPAVGAVAHRHHRHACTWAPSGDGAWMEATPGGTRPDPHVAHRRSPPDIRLVASKSHRTARIDAVKQALQITDEINVGSIGLKIGLVSEGARDLYFYAGGRTKIWDTCGPEAILARGRRPPDRRRRRAAGLRPARPLQPARHRRLERPAARLSSITRSRRWSRTY